MDLVRVSAVSYLNTLPFQYGFVHGPKVAMDLSLDIPSECAQKLIDGQAEVGLIPVATLPELPEFSIITDYCIAADGPVRTVLLYSDVPIHQVETIWLDYQSRTSVNLCRILCAEFWKVNPEFKATTPGFEQGFGDREAAVVIGDRTFRMEKEYAYTYDLSEVWKDMTGLSFVFAAWVAHAVVSPEFTRAFNELLRFGMEHRQEAIDQYLRENDDPGDLQGYLMESIKYEWGTKEAQALQLFLTKLDGLPPLPK
jgi:chorismate dehydratase